MRYFEWMGAARYTADHRAGAMHGKQFLLDSAYAGIDERNLYGRLDFAGQVPETDFELVINVESWAADGLRPRGALRLGAVVEKRKLQSWKVSLAGEDRPPASSENPGGSEAKLVLARNFEFRLPLSWLLAIPVSSGDGSKAVGASVPVATRLRLRFSLWQNGLPVDALPLEGWIELELLSEEDLMSMGY